VRSSPYRRVVVTCLHGSVWIPVGRIHQERSPQKPTVTQHDVAVGHRRAVPQPPCHCSPPDVQVRPAVGRASIARSSLGSCQPGLFCLGSIGASCRPGTGCRPCDPAQPHGEIGLLPCASQVASCPESGAWKGESAFESCDLLQAASTSGKATSNPSGRARCPRGQRTRKMSDHGNLRVNEPRRHSELSGSVQQSAAEESTIRRAVAEGEPVSTLPARPDLAPPDPVDKHSVAQHQWQCGQHDDQHGH